MGSGAESWRRPIVVGILNYGEVVKAMCCPNATILLRLNVSFGVVVVGALAYVKPGVAAPCARSETAARQDVGLLAPDSNAGVLISAIGRSRAKRARYEVKETRLELCF